MLLTRKTEPIKRIRDKTVVEADKIIFDLETSGTRYKQQMPVVIDSEITMVKITYGDDNNDNAPNKGVFVKAVVSDGGQTLQAILSHTGPLSYLNAKVGVWVNLTEEEEDGP